MTSRRAAAALLALMLTAPLLAGCDPRVPMPTPTTTRTASPTASPTPTATPTSTPDEEEPAQAPTAVTCESLLSTSLTTYTTGGLSIVDEATTSTRLHNEGDPFALFFDAGGVVCVISTGSEAYGIYSWGPIKDPAWASIRSALLGEGWSEQVTDAGFELDAPEPGPLSLCYYRPNQFAGCASTFALLDEVFDNAP